MKYMWEEAIRFFTTIFTAVLLLIDTRMFWSLVHVTAPSQFVVLPRQNEPIFDDYLNETRHFSLCGARPTHRHVSRCHNTPDPVFFIRNLKGSKSGENAFHFHEADAAAPTPKQSRPIKQKRKTVPGHISPPNDANAFRPIPGHQQVLNRLIILHKTAATCRAPLLASDELITQLFRIVGLRFSDIDHAEEDTPPVVALESRQNTQESTLTNISYASDAQCDSKDTYWLNGPDGTETPLVSSGRGGSFAMGTLFLSGKRLKLPSVSRCQDGKALPGITEVFSRDNELSCASSLDLPRASILEPSVSQAMRQRGVSDCGKQLRAWLLTDFQQSVAESRGHHLAGFQRPDNKSISFDPVPSQSERVRDAQSSSEASTHQRTPFRHSRSFVHSSNGMESNSRDQTVAMLQTSVRLATAIELVRRTTTTGDLGATQGAVYDRNQRDGEAGRRPPTSRLPDSTRSSQFNRRDLCKVASLLEKPSKRISLKSTFLEKINVDIIRSMDLPVFEIGDLYSLATRLPCVTVERDQFVIPASSGIQQRDTGDPPSAVSVSQTGKLDRSSSNRPIPWSSFMSSSRLLHTHYGRYIGLATAWRSLQDVKTITMLVAVIDVFLPGFSSLEFHRCSEAGHWCRGSNFGNPSADALPESSTTTDSKARPAMIAAANLPHSSIGHHGTSVGSVIAGVSRDVGDGSSRLGGVPGVCPFCVIVPLNIHIPETIKEPVASMANLLQALEFLLNHPLIKISNLSMNFGGRSPSLERAFLLLEKQGHIMVAAAGNSAINLDSFGTFQIPQMLRRHNVLVVGAIDTSKSRHHQRMQEQIEVAAFSNYGSETVNLFAPGVNILAFSGNNGRVQQLAGTSAAAPLVTSAVALLWAKFPNWNYLEVSNHLQTSSRPLQQLAGLAITGGTLDIGTAMTGVAPRNFLERNGAPTTERCSPSYHR